MGKIQRFSATTSPIAGPSQVMKTDNMNPIIWCPSNKRYRLALHLCLLLVLPKEALAERTQAQSANRAPIVILQEDEKEQPIPVGISSVVYDDYSSVAPEAAAKSYCTPPCGLYVAPGPLTLRLGGLGSGLRVNHAVVHVPTQGLKVVLASPRRSNTGAGITMAVLGGLALNIGPLVMMLKPTNEGYGAGAITLGLGVFGLLIPGILISIPAKPEIKTTYPLSKDDAAMINGN